MQKVMRIIQEDDGSTSVEDNLTGGERAKGFAAGDRDGLTEHVAHLLSKLDNTAPTPPAEPATDGAGTEPKENPVTEQVKEGADAAGA